MADQVRVFVSHHHSPEEDAFTVRLVANLEAAGADVWVDTSGIPSGSFVAKISEGLAGRQWVVLVMTPAALTSPWVRSEVEAALQEVHGRRMLGVIPLVLEPCEVGDIPVLWRTLQRYDATRDYQTALTGLLRALGLAAPAAQSSPAPPSSPAYPDSSSSIPASAPQPVASPPTAPESAQTRLSTAGIIERQQPISSVSGKSLAYILALGGGFGVFTMSCIIGAFNSAAVSDHRFNNVTTQALTVAGLLVNLVGLPIAGYLIVRRIGDIRPVLAAGLVAGLLTFVGLLIADAQFIYPNQRADCLLNYPPSSCDIIVGPGPFEYGTPFGFLFLWLVVVGLAGAGGAIGRMVNRLRGIPPSTANAKSEVARRVPAET